MLLERRAEERRGRARPHRGQPSSTTSPSPGLAAPPAAPWTRRVRRMSDHRRHLADRRRSRPSSTCSPRPSNPVSSAAFANALSASSLTDGERACRPRAPAPPPTATRSSTRPRSTSASPTSGAAPTRRRAWTARAWCSSSTRTRLRPAARLRRPGQVRPAGREHGRGPARRPDRVGQLQPQQRRRPHRHLHRRRQDDRGPAHRPGRAPQSTCPHARRRSAGSSPTPLPSRARPSAPPPRPHRAERCPTSCRTPTLFNTAGRDVRRQPDAALRRRQPGVGLRRQGRQPAPAPRASCS